MKIRKVFESYSKTFSPISEEDWRQKDEEAHTLIWKKHPNKINIIENAMIEFNNTNHNKNKKLTLTIDVDTITLVDRRSEDRNQRGLLGIKRIYIYYFDDEWFYVDVENYNSHSYLEDHKLYKCDQWDGLLDCLKFIYNI